jgi:hypothetical protein
MCWLDCLLQYGLSFSNYGVVSFPVCLLPYWFWQKFGTSFFLSDIYMKFYIIKVVLQFFWTFVLVLLKFILFYYLLLGITSVIATNYRKPILVTERWLCQYSDCIFIYNCLGTPYVHLGNESISRFGIAQHVNTLPSA